MHDMLAAEKSKVVCMALLAMLPCSDYTRKFFMKRSHDVADDLSRAAPRCRCASTAARPAGLSCAYGREL